jgi:hypothetical protein
VLVARSEVAQPAELQGITIEPGQRAGFDLSTLLQNQETALLISASGPVVVDRSISSDGDITRSEAIVDLE